MSAEAARTALEPNTTQIYLSNLPFLLSEAQLVEFFESKIGVKPSKLTIPPGGFPRSRRFASEEPSSPFPSSSLKRNRGFAFAVFADDEVERVLSLNQSVLSDREIGVTKAEEKSEEEKQASKQRRLDRLAQLRARREKRVSASSSAAASSETPAASDSTPVEAEQNSLRVYVNNIPYSSTDQQLKEFFEQNGLDVADMKIVFSSYNRKNKKSEEDETTKEGEEEKPEKVLRSKGFGFLTLENEESKKQALALNEIEFGERSLIIQEVRPRRRPATSSTENPVEGEQGEKKKKRRNAKKKKVATDSAEGEVAREPSSSPASAAEGETAEGEKKKKRRTRKPRKAKEPEGEAAPAETQ